MHSTRDLKTKADQCVQDTIVAIRIIDGHRNAQNGAYLKNHATFPLEFFDRVTVQMRERLHWYKTTIEVRNSLSPCNLSYARPFHSKLNANLLQLPRKRNTPPNVSRLIPVVKTPLTAQPYSQRLVPRCRRNTQLLWHLPTRPPLLTQNFRRSRPCILNSGGRARGACVTHSMSWTGEPGGTLVWRGCPFETPRVYPRRRMHGISRHIYNITSDIACTVRCGCVAVWHWAINAVMTPSAPALVYNLGHDAKN